MQRVRRARGQVLTSVVLRRGSDFGRPGYSGYTREAMAVLRVDLAASVVLKRLGSLLRLRTRGRARPLYIGYSIQYSLIVYRD